MIGKGNDNKDLYVCDYPIAYWVQAILSMKISLVTIYIVQRRPLTLYLDSSTLFKTLLLSDSKGGVISSEVALNPLWS